MARKTKEETERHRRLVRLQYFRELEKLHLNPVFENLMGAHFGVAQSIKREEADPVYDNRWTYGRKYELWTNGAFSGSRKAGLIDVESGHESTSVSLYTWDKIATGDFVDVLNALEDKKIIHEYQNVGVPSWCQFQFQLPVGSKNYDANRHRWRSAKSTELV